VSGPVGTVELDGNMLVVEARPHVALQFRRMFVGAHRRKACVFELVATPERAYDVHWFSTRYPLQVAPDSAARFAELVAQHERKLAAIAELYEAGYVPREFDLAIPPREYQRMAADLLVRAGSLLIADEVGTGKTCTAICALAAPGSLPAVVVTMTHLTRQWEREIARFAPRLRVHRIRKGEPYAFTDVRVEVDPDTKRRRVMRNKGVPDVILINYHKLHRWAETLSGIARAVIFDECQELRHSGTHKYTAARAIAEAADVRGGLTATPVYNYGVEIYNVMDVVAPGQLGTAKEFLDSWCGGGGDGDERQVRDGKAMVSDPAALGSYLRETGLMIRRTRKDVGRELPALTLVRHVVECDPESIAQATADVAELARRVLDRIGSPLEQMRAAGEIDYKLRQATGIAKAAAVAEFVRLLVESGERVVLYAWHHEVYALLQSHFDRGVQIPYALYTGKQSDKQKDDARARFVDGDAQVMIISLRAGAGLDGLQRVCRTCVTAELDWSPAVMHQDHGRVHRDGQQHPVMAYVLVAEEGSDPVIEDVLGIKHAQSQWLLNPADGKGDAIQAGAAADHVRRLAESVLAKVGAR